MDEKTTETKIAVMQVDISELKTQIASVKSDVSDTKVEVSEITERLVRIETLLENRGETQSADHGISLSLKEVFLVLFVFVLVVLLAFGVNLGGIL